MIIAEYNIFRVDCYFYKGFVIHLWIDEREYAGQYVYRHKSSAVRAAKKIISNAKKCKGDLPPNPVLRR